MYDHFPRLEIIGIGSSALNIHKGEADLSRRIHIFCLNELSFREFLELSQNIRLSPASFENNFNHHHEICTEIIKKTKPVRLFLEYLNHCCFPYFLEEKDYYHGRLRSTINTILESNLPALENISYHSIVQIEKLLFILSESYSFITSTSELGKKIKHRRLLSSKPGFIVLNGLGGNVVIRITGIRG